MQRNCGPILIGNFTTCCIPSRIYRALVYALFFRYDRNVNSCYYIEKNNNEYYNKNPFVLQHVSNSVILGSTGCSKTSLLNILTLNPVFEKVCIITKQPEEKYDFLIKKFPKDVKIFYQNDEYDLDELIYGNKQVCCIFDDLISDTDYISQWFVRSKKRIVQIFSKSFIL